MVVLLQSYPGTSDAAVELAVIGLRWQMVLGLGATKPPFSQGVLSGFRERLIAHDMDRRLLERTVELARSTKEFDRKKLPKTLRVAIDSAPLEGAGRWRTPSTCSRTRRARWSSARPISCAGRPSVCREARAPLILAPSIKAALDRDWSDPVQKAAAVKSLVIELESEHDLDLREQIARGVFTASPEFLDRADAWLQRLAGAARALPDGGASALVHEAAFRWARVCRRMRKLGLHALRRFRQSPLHGAAPASTKVQVALGALAGALAPRIAARRRSDVPR